ncbi:MAG: hypothetical protein [Circular genetic element sp.]|nr:MAG: hypothetical protein [Circular genetic element sp.]
MARRTSNKIQPAVMTIQCKSAGVGSGATGEFTLDLSQMASLVNRRFYRQGLNWAVAGFKILTTQNGVLTTKKLPNTWIMSNAWEKSMRSWMRMNNEALSETESIRPRFLDFKIYADATHHQAGFIGNLLPLDGRLPINQTYALGEWEASKVVIPLTDGSDNAFSREMIAVGASYPGNSAVTGLNAVSLIDGYASSRGLPNVLDPNAPDDAASVNGAAPQNWMAAIFNQGTDQDDLVLDDMITENNLAPYPFENDGTNLDTMYPGGANQAPSLEIHDTSFITGTTLSGTTRVKGGNFPCGLVRFEYTNTSDTTGNLVIQIDLVPGNHRGYLCEPMTEM